MLHFQFSKEVMVLKRNDNLVERIAFVATTLNVCNDAHNYRKFISFLMQRGDYYEIVKEFHSKLKKALGYNSKLQCYMSSIDENKKMICLYSEYLDAIQELSDKKDDSKLKELFSKPIAYKIVEVFKRDIDELFPLHKDFENYKRSLIKKTDSQKYKCSLQ